MKVLIASNPVIFREVTPPYYGLRAHLSLFRIHKKNFRFAVKGNFGKTSSSLEKRAFPSRALALTINNCQPLTLQSHVALRPPARLQKDPACGPTSTERDPTGGSILFILLKDTWSHPLIFLLLQVLFIGRYSSRFYEVHLHLHTLSSML